MAENKKSISMEIRADGSLARRETAAVARDVAAMKRKSEQDVMAVAAGKASGTRSIIPPLLARPPIIPPDAVGGAVADSLGSQRLVITADGSQASAVINNLRAELSALAKDAATPIVIAAPRQAAGSVVPGRSAAITAGTPGSSSVIPPLLARRPVAAPVVAPAPPLLARQPVAPTPLVSGVYQSLFDRPVGVPSRTYAPVAAPAPPLLARRPVVPTPLVSGVYQSLFDRPVGVPSRTYAPVAAPAPPLLARRAVAPAAESYPGLVGGLRARPLAMPSVAPAAAVPTLLARRAVAPAASVVPGRSAAPAAAPSLMTLQADGGPARAEAKSTIEAINAEAAKVKPWSLGGTVKGTRGIAYDKTLRGFGGINPDYFNPLRNTPVGVPSRVYAPAVAPPPPAVAVLSAARRPLSLRATDPDHQQLLSDRAAKAVLMTIKADGGPARAEAKSTVEAVNAESRKVKPWSLGGAVKGALGGAYDKTFKGLGGDISRGFGLDKLFGGAQSGFGKMASLASFAFTGVFRAATFTFSAITGGLRMAGNLIMSALTAPLRMATTAFKALGIVAASAAAGVYAGLKALRPAADMQQYQIQMEVLLRDPAKAKARLAELTKFAKETNYGPAEVIESANLMEAFGIYGNDISRLKLAGDAANAFGKDIREVVRSVSYLSSGRTGEAMESLSRIGVTRDKLKPFGVEFSKSGEMTTEPKKAIDAVFRYFAEAFGGMTARQSKTWKGAIQQLGGEVYDAFARGFKSALVPLTQFVTGNVIPMIDSIGNRLQAIKWDKLLSGPMKMLGGMTEIINKLADPATAAQGMVEFKGLGSDLWAGAKTALSAFGAVGMGLLKDLGGIFEAFVGGGGIGKIFALAWDGLKLAMEGGAGLFKIVLSGFSAEFLSGLKMALDVIPGVNTGETAKRAAAEKNARQAVFDQMDDAEYQRVIEGANKGFDLADWVKTHLGAKRGVGDLNPVVAFRNTANAARDQMENTALQHFLAQPGQAGAKARAAYNATVRSEMGWDGPRDAGDPMAAFNAQRGKFAGSLGGFMDTLVGMGERSADRAVAEKYAGDQSAPVQAARRQARTAAGEKAAAEGRVVTARDIEREFAGAMRRSDPEAEKLWTGVKAVGGFGNTAQALGALPDRIAAGFAPARERLSGNAREAALRAEGVRISEKAREYDDKAATKMSALRQAGWQMVTRDDRGRVVRDPMTGKLVPFETERRGERAAAARREYYTIAQQRRQTGAAYQTAYRDTVSERLGLTGERKEKYWSLVDRSREEYRQYYRRYESRVQAGDKEGAEGVKKAWRGRLGAYQQAVGNIVKDTAKPGETAAARRDYYTVAQQRRQTGAAYQTAYRDTVSERLGLTGERKERYWSLVDRSREEYRQYYRRYQDRVQAGDAGGATAVRREWAGRLQGYRQESGNLVKDATKPGEPAAGDQARAEKSLGDMAVLLAQQKILQTNLLAAMQGVESTLKLVLGVA